MIRLSTTRSARNKLSDGLNSNQFTEEYDLRHSKIVLEHGPAGTIARVERDGGVDYAGPLPTETILAIVEMVQ